MEPALAHNGAVAAASAVISWPSLVVSGVAVAIALGALWSNYYFRRADALAALLRRYEDGHFHVRMWRTEQLTRDDPNPWAIKCQRVSDLRSTLDEQKLDFLNKALGSDWSAERFDIQASYFYALQVRQWLPAHARWARRRAKLLNKTFGYQLLSTFLDQRITACRLLPDDDHDGIEDQARPSYYPTHYGLFDPRYNELVDWLADDLLRKGNQLPGRVEEVLTKKRRAIDTLLATLSSQGASPAVRDDAGS